MSDIQSELSRVRAALNTLRAPGLPGEYDLHGMIAEALSRADIPFQHEARILPRCRIDFLIGSVGIEVKKGRPNGRALLNQLTRYLQSPVLGGIIVVTQQNVSLPAALFGKPVLSISLNRLWGVALP